MYKCEVCGFEADRDLNAAMRLESVAASSAETLNAFERRVPVDEAGTEHHPGGVLDG